jgi:hypothetical protein
MNILISKLTWQTSGRVKMDAILLRPTAEVPLGRFANRPYNIISVGQVSIPARLF